MSRKNNWLKKVVSVGLIVGFLIGGSITIFAEEATGAAGTACAESSDMNLFFFIYQTLKGKSGDIFSLLAATVSLTVFLVVKQYLIPLLNRVLKSIGADLDKEKNENCFDDDEKEE